MLFEGVPVNDKVNDKLTHIRISKISETFYSMLLAFQLFRSTSLHHEDVPPPLVQKQRGCFLPSVPPAGGLEKLWQRPHLLARTSSYISPSLFLK